MDYRPFPQSLLPPRTGIAAARIILASLVLTLQACGGGGGGGEPPTGQIPVNRAPAFASLADDTIAEGTTTDIEIAATDIDGGALVLTTSTLPDFVALEPSGENLWRFTASPDFDDAGEYPITLTVTDADGASDEASITLLVANVNRAPSLTTPGDLAVSEGQSLSIQLAASDPDGDALSFGADSLPGFITIANNGDGTAELNLAPGYFSNGTHNVTVRVTDADGMFDEVSFVVAIANVNRPPMLTPVAPIILAEAAGASISLVATDPDADAVALTVIRLPQFAAAVDNGDGTGILTLAPGFLDSGTYIVTVRASDAGALTDEINIAITVNDVNRGPTLSVASTVDMNEDESFLAPIVASDADGDAVSLSISGEPPFATLTNNGDGTGSVAFSPGFSDSGTYAITIGATDDNAAVTESTLTLNVANVNRQPVITQLSDAALNEDESLDIDISASDPDNDTLTLSGTGLPGFVSLSDNGDGTGILEVQPDFEDAGIYPITVSVSDGSSTQADTNFFITVGDVNRAPVLANIAAITVAEGAEKTVLLSASDPDSDAVTFAADNLPDFVSLNNLGGGNAELDIAPALLDSGPYSIVVRAVDAGAPALSDEQSVSITVNLDGANHVAAENALPGTPDWHLDNPALLREIEGYASATSVNRGETISFFVNTNAPTFTLEVFRTGWYQGIGARRVLGPISNIPGTVQITPSPDPSTGLVEANWVNPYDIQTSDTIAGDPWPTGVYLARLTESAGDKQSYIIFVVREDGHQHDVLFQLPVTTYQSYNAWGGKSIYDWNSGFAEPWGSTAGTRASHLSFDRPYARNPFDPAGYGMGAGEYLTNVQPVGRIDGAGWDYNMVRWLEHEQYDVAYITNIDTHRSPGALLDTEVFLSQGHDEYWTWEMRDNVEAARDAGIDLAFFSSNAAYYQMRFEASSGTGTPDRIMVVYKDELLDPVFNDLNPLNDYLTTIPFRHLPIPRPEESLIGVQYVLDPYDGDIIVTNPTHWVFNKTGFVAGSLLKGLLGYEPDGIFDPGAVGNRDVLAETPIVSSTDPGNTGTSHMTIYSTPSASVFATGSLQWSWGLDDYNAPLLRTARTSAMAQQVTENVLGNFGALPYAGDDVVSASCVRIVSYSDATDDQTMAAAEFDLLDESGQVIPKTGWSLHFFDSEETIGWDHQAAYAIDGDPATFWQTEWFGAGHPHEMQIDLGGFFDISALRYVPRQDSSLDGTVIDYEVYTSPDCASWSLASSGNEWDASHGRKITRFAP